ncbi:hypothetical protein BDZ97DRAFT_1907687 [Flammula alnicola]|nr:hypothetical protein BDZ97DRAFT_1907687 [Flammula alnicola]
MYDIHRDYDTINPRTHPFIIVSSPEVESNPSAHPFWYGQVLGVFHTDVQHTGSKSCNLAWKLMDFLWVRWLGVVPAKLPKLGFVVETDEYVFGFLDPSLIIRGCHLMPAFIDGRTSNLLGTRAATEVRTKGQVDDWANYYVGIFVDRDMYLQFLGMGIGHRVNTAARSHGSDNMDCHDPDAPADTEMDEPDVEGEDDEEVGEEDGEGEDNDDGDSSEDSDDNDREEGSDDESDDEVDLGFDGL